MELNEFISKELRNLTIRELKNASSVNDKHAEKILKLFDSYFGNNNVSKEALDAWSNELNNSGFEVSEGCKFTIDQLSDFDAIDFDKRDLERIEQGLKYDPKNRIFPLLWILHKKSSFDSDEYLDAEYAQFLDKIIEEYDYIVNLEDFIDETNILLIKSIWEEWEKDIFLPVFEKASVRYPEKYAFKKILAFIHYKSKDYDQALSALNSIINSIEKELKENYDKVIGSSDFPYIDYLEVVQLTGMIHYTLGDPKKAMLYIKYVLNNLPVIEGECGVEPEIMSFVDSFFIRILYSIKTKNHVQIIKDFRVINGVLFLYDWENEYPEVFSFLRKRKLELA